MIKCWDKEFADRVAQSCISKFNSLGKSGKPRDKKEWTPLAGIVKEEEGNENLQVVALGTGSKCLGAKNLSGEGRLVHDSHAEVVAKRTFTLYLLHQIEHALNGVPSIFEVDGEKLRLLSGISYHFYASHTPCGDASIFQKQEWTESVGEMIKSRAEVTKEKTDKSDVSTEPLQKKVKLDKSDIEQNEVIATIQPPKSCSDIHRTGAKCVTGERVDLKQPGSNYHVTGVLRTKPGRGDPTLSMSCSDKMFRWTVLGIQGSLPMLFLQAPIYIKTITIGNCPFNEEAMQRALFDRFKEQLKCIQLPGEFYVATPVILQSDVDFPFSRDCVSGSGIDGNQMMPSPTSLIWSPSSGHKHEVATNGHKLGTTFKNQADSKVLLSISRRSMFLKAHKIMMSKKHFRETYTNITCDKLKRQAYDYHQVWETLKLKVLCNWTEKPKYTKEFQAKE